jgi:hypothetical protein
MIPVEDGSEAQILKAVEAHAITILSRKAENLKQ